MQSGGNNDGKATNAEEILDEGLGESTKGGYKTTTVHSLNIEKSLEPSRKDESEKRVKGKRPRSLKRSYPTPFPAK